MNNSNFSLLPPPPPPHFEVKTLEMDEAFNYLPGKEVGGAAVWLKGEEGEGDNYKEDTLSANLKRGRKRRGKQLEIHSSFSSLFASGGRNAPKNRGGKRRNKDWIHRSRGRGRRVHLPQTISRLAGQGKRSPVHDCIEIPSSFSRYILRNIYF